MVSSGFQSSKFLIAARCCASSISTWRKIAVNKQWHLLEEVVGSALHRLERQLSGREVRIEIPEDFPLCHFDDVLIEQLIINLLDTTVKYSREGTPIAIRAEKLTDAVMIEVADRGEGFAPGDEVRAFEMFFRGSQGDSRRRGSGLGLAICRAIINAHGGRFTRRIAQAAARW